jgi:hypothetical protein
MTNAPTAPMNMPMSEIHRALPGVLLRCLMGALMIWIFGGTAFSTFLMWAFAPTGRTIFRNYCPSRRNDAIVFQAQHSSSHG